MKKSEPKLRPGRWWALLHHPGDLPVLFATRAQALGEREADEYLVRVTVQPVPRPRRPRR